MDTSNLIEQDMIIEVKSQPLCRQREQIFVVYVFVTLEPCNFAKLFFNNRDCQVMT